MGLYLDKTKQFLKGIRVITIGLAILFVSACYLLTLGKLSVSCMFAVLAGILNVPILPSTYGLSTVLVGNIPPAVVNGLMMSGA